MGSSVTIKAEEDERIVRKSSLVDGKTLAIILSVSS
jgi:hypothetical protein